MIMSTTMPTFEADLLSRVINPDAAGLSPQAAQSILEMTFSDDDRDKMDVLAKKAQQGELTPAEQEEIDGYERVGNFLSLIKSKARLSLQNVTDLS